MSYTIRAGCIEITGTARTRSDLAVAMHTKYGFTEFWFTPPEGHNHPQHKRVDPPNMVMQRGRERL